MLVNIIRSPNNNSFTLVPRKADANYPIVTVEEASAMSKLCIKTIKDILSHNYTIICKKETCTISQN